MKILEYELSFTENELNKNAMPVIIVAAGSSTRMNGISKPFAMVGGLPVIVRTLLAFERSKCISNIILVTKEEFVCEMQKYADEYMISKLTDIVVGGSNRQESVLNGLKAVKGAKKVLIHDGARPLLSGELITRVCEEIMVNDCVVCAVNVVDTIKKIGPDGFVIKTYNRDELFCIQTPQAVDINKYLPILENADRSHYTDDASVMEGAGIPVKVVKGEYSNIKITTPDDIALAEFYIEKQGESQ